MGETEMCWIFMGLSFYEYLVGLVVFLCNQGKFALHPWKIRYQAKKLQIQMRVSNDVFL